MNGSRKCLIIFTILACVIVAVFYSSDAKAGKPAAWQANYEVDVWIGGRETSNHKGHGYVYAQQTFSTIASNPKLYDFKLLFYNCMNLEVDHSGQFYIQPATKRSTGMFSFFIPGHLNPDGSIAPAFQLLSTAENFVGDQEGGKFDLFVPSATLYLGSNQTPTYCPPITDIYVHGERIP